MDKTKLLQLVDLYFEGQTNLEEEKVLKNYFASNQVEEELLLYQPLFQTLQLEQEIKLPDTFEADLMSTIEGRSSYRVTNLRRLPKVWITRVAAVLVLGLGLTWMYYPTSEATVVASTIDWSSYEPETPEEAMQVYKQAMLKLGKALNDGANTAATNVKRVEEVSKFFD